MFLCTPSLKSKCGCGRCVLVRIHGQLFETFSQLLSNFSCWGSPEPFLSTSATDRIAIETPEPFLSTSATDRIAIETTTSSNKEQKVITPDRGQPNPLLLFREGEGKLLDLSQEDKGARR